MKRRLVGSLMAAAAVIFFIGMGAVVVAPDDFDPAAPDVKVEYWDAEKRQVRRIERLDKEGRGHGDTRTYYKDGKLAALVAMEHGQMVLVEGWHPNGRREYLQPFADGLPHGVWQWWNKSL